MGKVLSAAHFKKMYDRVSALAKIGVWECNLATGEVTWTDMVYDIFGIPRNAAINRETALRLYEPNSRREMEHLRKRAISNGTGFTLDIQIRPSINEVRWIRLTAEVEHEAGRAVRIFGTKQDITGERAARDRLQALQSDLIHLSRGSAMWAMAATIAHELNQPLTAVSGYLSAARRIQNSPQDEPSITKCIDGAVEAAHRAGDILRSVRAMGSKGDEKRISLELEPLLREAVGLATAGSAQLFVNWQISPELFVVGDPIQIQQVMINIIRNSCEASGGATCHIRIRAEAANGQVTVDVLDDGPGIPNSIVADMFDAFFSTKSSGLGLGLSISRTIIEAHGGHIWAVNIPTGGASIFFTLPQAEEVRMGPFGVFQNEKALS